MKKIIFILGVVVFLICTKQVLSQVPQKISYQSVVRDATGALIRSKTISIRLTILESSADGRICYSEVHLVQTNKNGLATLNIGAGNVLEGSFSELNWGTGSYFLKVETDPEGATNYSITATSEIVSVPFALYAQKAASIDLSSLQAPTSNTLDATDLQSSSAQLNGTVNANGFLTTIDFEWGTTTEYGKTINAGYASGSETKTISISLDSLHSAQLYHFRIRSQNAVDITLGEDKTFTTTSLLPVLTTVEINSVDSLSATGGGVISELSGSDILVRGVCWNTSGMPTVEDSKTNNGSGGGLFLSSITGLTPSTTYYVRAYATNNSGTGYGDEVSFTTFNSSAIKDADGNLYNTQKYGVQTWSLENLKTTQFSDGSSIVNETENETWSGLSSPAYCWLNNDSANKNKRGALYNGYAAISGKLCPSGWNVPSEFDWNTLATYFEKQGLGYEGSGQDIAKAMASSSGWESSSQPGTVGNNPSGNNSSGFNGILAGERLGLVSAFWDDHQRTWWWASSNYDTNLNTCFGLKYNDSTLISSSDYLSAGLSVRCVKNDLQPKVSCINKDGTSFELYCTLKIPGEIYYVVLKLDSVSKSGDMDYYAPSRNEIYSAVSQFPSARIVHISRETSDESDDADLFVCAGGIIHMDQPGSYYTKKVSGLPFSHGTYFKVYYFVADRANDGFNNLSGGTGLVSTNNVSDRFNLIGNIFDILPPFVEKWNANLADLTPAQNDLETGCSDYDNDGIQGIDSLGPVYVKMNENVEQASGWGNPITASLIPNIFSVSSLGVTVELDGTACSYDEATFTFTLVPLIKFPSGSSMQVILNPNKIQDKQDNPDFGPNGTELLESLSETFCVE